MFDHDYYNPFALTKREIDEAKLLRLTGIDDDAIAEELSWRRQLTDKVTLSSTKKLQRAPNKDEGPQAVNKKLSVLEREKAEIEHHLTDVKEELDRTRHAYQADLDVANSRITDLENELELERIDENSRDGMLRVLQAALLGGYAYNLESPTDMNSLVREITADGERLLGKPPTRKTVLKYVELAIASLNNAMTS